MTYEFAKYPDGTLGVFSNIGKKENGEEYIRITFERPKEYGFDTEEEKKTFLEIVKNGSSFFFKYARLGGLEIAQYF